MKIIVSSPIFVLDASGEPVSKSDDLKVLDGLYFNEDVLSNYIDEEPLEEIGLEGGDIRLAFDAESKQLLVISEYVSPRKLNKKEVNALAEYTSAQWSDGMGEDLFTEQFHKHGWIENLVPKTLRDVSIKQVDDGKATKKRLSRLLKAAQKGELEEVQKLLLRGEDINSENKWGQSALYGAIGNSQTDCAIFLIEHGAKVDGLAPHTSGPLHIAAMVGAVELTRVLLQKGANVNATDDRFYTPAMWAADRGHLDVLKLLVSSEQI